MTCSDVGSTNADIAGLGIILSFTIQAGLSFLLSLWSIFLDLRLQGLVFTGARAKWWAHDPDTPSSHNPRGNWRASVNRVPSVLQSAGVLSDPATLNQGSIDAWTLKKHLIERVLKTISDMQTLNGTFAQHGTLDLYHYHVIYDTVNLTGVSAAAALTITFQKPNAILFRGTSVLVFLALYFGFVIVFGLKLQQWDEGLSGRCYKTDAVSTLGSAHPYVDNIYLAITSLYMFASLSICLQAAKDSLSALLQSSIHPDPDDQSERLWNLAIGRFNLIMGAITDLDLTSLATGATDGDAIGSRSLWLYERFYRRLQELGWHTTLPGAEPGILLRPMDRATAVLCLALFQYPVHSYMIYALRSSNERYLSGDSENEWGFGQVVALVLVGSVVLECIRATIEYNIAHWKRKKQAKDSIWQKFLSLLQVLLVDEDAKTGPGVARAHLMRPRRRQSLPDGFKYA
ncbi:hypothetical protein BJ170DRAFT_222856 [Xylariales sp. AK1849]|nr:hypothetical protein BJ170DRAFT_222856 [Xylariales sp. AK1849]